MWAPASSRPSVSVSASASAFTTRRQPPGRWRWVASTSSVMTRLIHSLDLGRCSFRRLCLLRVGSRQPGVTDADGKSLPPVYGRTSTATRDAEAFFGCPQGRDIGRAWLAHPGADFEPVGLFCPHDGEVTSVADMSARIRGDIVEKVPPLGPGCLPARGAVVGIDLHCRSGQSSTRLGWSTRVVGHAVVAEANATWFWAFEQRARADLSTPTATTEWVHTVGFPGGVYPDRGIRQTFTDVGRRLVRVRSAWRGRYWVDGVGPFDVQDPVRQDHAWELDVGSAVGVLMQ